VKLHFGNAGISLRDPARTARSRVRVPGAGTGCPFAGRRDPPKRRRRAAKPRCSLARQLLTTPKRVIAAFSSAIALEMLEAQTRVD